MVAQHSEFNKNHCIVYLRWVTSIMHELYLNKDFKKIITLIDVSLLKLNCIMIIT